MAERERLVPRLQKVFLRPSRTQQHYRDEVNIMEIVRRSRKDGYVEHVSRAAAYYGDVEHPESYQDAMNIVVAGRRAFGELPADLRERFRNDPVRMITWLANPENRDEAQRLGLVQAVSVEVHDEGPASKAGDPSPSAAADADGNAGG